MQNTRLARIILFPALAALLVAGFVAISAGSANARALLLATLARTAGEDPTVSGTLDPAFVAIGDARLTDQGLVRVNLSFLDAARYPAGALAEVRAGSLKAMVPLTAFVPEVLGATDNPLGATTALDSRQFGFLAEGDKVEVRIRAEFVVNGVRQRHETRWSGVMVAK